METITVPVEDTHLKPNIHARIWGSNTGYFYVIHRTSDDRPIILCDEKGHPTRDEAKEAATKKIRDLYDGKYGVPEAGDLFGYAHQVQQIYWETDRTGTPIQKPPTSYGMPHFAIEGEAIKYLDAAPFPGQVLRYAKDPFGRKGMITAGVVYEKGEGERAYWKARALMLADRNWTLNGMPVHIAGMLPGHTLELPFGKLHRKAEITRAEWAKIHQDYKGEIEGEKNIMQLNETGRTYLQPVKIID